MDSANGFCLPRKCPLLIIKKQKNMFFLLFFITSSLLSNSRRKKWTAQIQPGQARERGGPGIRHSYFSSPRANGPPQQLPYPSALRNRKPCYTLKLGLEIKDRENQRFNA